MINYDFIIQTRNTSNWYVEYFLSLYSLKQSASRPITPTSKCLVTTINSVNLRYLLRIQVHKVIT